MNFFLSVLLLTADASGESLEHLRAAKWKETIPKVVICDGLPIETELVQKSVEYWRARGEKIGAIQRKTCAEEPKWGEIAIYRGDDLPEDHAGEAMRYLKNEKVPPKIDQITRASIYIKERHIDSEILIRHELGHALGFTDSDDEDSVMSSTGSLY